jgi:UDP-glucuronate 4-epimerase
MATTLITGAAGFIGFHTAAKLLGSGESVVGVDNLNAYYDPRLKEARLAQLRKQPRFEFARADVADTAAIEALFAKHRFTKVIHLAAQAGVRYSITDPHAYVDANLKGFLNILEGCRHHGLPHLVYASTSSVYGANGKQPFSEHQATSHPMSLYAATKKANELMAHSYASLYQLPVTGLRFFTVYGPWGRPDMALFKFTRGILAGEAIPVFNNGQMVRDFTYVSDIVEGVVRISDIPAAANPHWKASADTPDPATSYAPYRIFNIGNNRPVQLLDYIKAIEDALGMKAQLDLQPMQPGDVPSTCADVSALEEATGFRPQTSVATGVRNFVEWYRRYYGV